MGKINPRLGLDAKPNLLTALNHVPAILLVMMRYQNTYQADAVQRDVGLPSSTI